MAEAPRRPFQEGRSVLHCNRIMFENSIACDVRFEVGNSDNQTQKILAHSYILICRSPVFEIMFLSGQRPDDGVIKIPDIDPSAFRELLRYMYFEEADVNASTVVPLWYAALKYMVTDVVKLCDRYFKESIDIDNVCNILELAMLYGNTDVQHTCLCLICQNTEKVFKSAEFLDLPYSALEKIVAYEELKSVELQTFEACHRWSVERCKRRGAEPTGKNVRHFMGNALFLIRFPIMDAKEFSDIVVPSQVLTDKETAEIFHLILSDVCDKSKVCFRKDQRKELLICSRFTTVSTDKALDYTSDNIEALTFKCDQTIIFRGVGLFGAKVDKVVLEVDLSIMCIATGSIAKAFPTRIESDGTESPKNVYMANPVVLRKDEWYSLQVDIKGGATFCGENGVNTQTSGCVTFTFKDSETINNETALATGQIPHILFYRF